jgi:outer membrane protein assembly factor BamC
METLHVISFRSNFSALTLCAIALTTLSACSSIEQMVSGDKIDYRSAAPAKTAGLEVPPDLSKLANDSRYQVQGGSVSAAALQSGAAASGTTGAAAKPASVATNTMGDVRIERQGEVRWLSTPLSPEDVWPKLQGFWKDNGFTLLVDQPAAGVMETDWAENRAKLPQDFIRATVGRIFEALYSTGERDKFRTRVERGPKGTEIYIAHRGMAEVYRGTQKDSTGWENRPSDPLLEGEFLWRLMAKLGTPPEQAKQAVAATEATGAGAAAPAAPAVPVRARVVDGRPEATLQVDDGFDRAWRRVGLALDRGGFTVEDRDRAKGIYFVRYVEPALAGKEEPSFLARLFSSNQVAGPDRYRVVVKSDGAASNVSIQSEKGEPENGPTGKRIVTLLVDALK